MLGDPDSGYELIRNNTAGRGADKLGAVVLDATGITQSSELSQLFEFFGPTMRATAAAPGSWSSAPHPNWPRHPSEHIAQRALEGFTRSLGKELRKGCHRTARLRLARRQDRTVRPRVDAPLPALGQVRIRRRPGHPRRREGRRRPGQLGQAAAGQGRARDRCCPRYRRHHRRGPRPRRRPCHRRRHPGRR